jgi:outer membrane protein assembly factor BamB
VEEHLRTLNPDGSITNDVGLIVAKADGVFLLGYEDTGRGAQVFDPPITLLGAAAKPGESWSSHGTLGSSPYRWKGKVVDRAKAHNDLGSFSDCIHLESTLTLTVSDGTAPPNDVTTVFTDEDCAGIGPVRSTIAGPSPYTLTAVGATDRTATASPPAAAGAAADAAVDSQPGDWGLRRLGTPVPVSGFGHATIAPVFVPGATPEVLAAFDGGQELVAISAGDVGGGAVWRVPTGGAVYGEPAVDVKRGRIYFGAADGRLRAVDTRGLFLWSVPTQDNVVTRPVVAGGIVVFGSEDGTVYGVDADDGKVVWAHDAGSPVAASPALVDGVVAIGADSGAVTGFDPATGKVRWTHSSGGAVDAAIAPASHGFVVADWAGNVSLLDAKTGAARWETTVLGGTAVHGEPAIVNGRVVVVAEDGGLAAVDARTGKPAWVVKHRGYAGWPAAVGDNVVVGRDNGDVDVLDARGRVIVTRSVKDALGPRDLLGEFELGPTVGGGEIWMADTRAIVRSLGPATGGQVDVAAAWFKLITDKPFDSLPMAFSAVDWKGQAVLFDGQRTAYVLDPQTGTGSRRFSFKQDGEALLADAVVDGDTVVLDLNSAVVAFDLSTGTRRWAVPHAEGSRPLVVHDGTVVFVAGGDGPATITGVELATGKVLWTADTGVVAFGTGMAEADGVAYGGNPLTAYSVADGRVLWTSTAADPAGTAAVDTDRGAVYVDTYSGGAAGNLTALDIHDGTPVWSVVTDNEAEKSTDRLDLGGNTVLVDSVTDTLVGHDAATGATTWSFKAPGAILGLPSIIDGRVWIALTSGQVVLLDADTGAHAGAFGGIGTDLLGTSVAQRPVAVGGVVIIPTGNAIMGLKATP